MTPLILGSRSPRRKEILDFFTYPFIQAASNFDEASVPFKGNPYTYVTEISKKKGESLLPIYPKDLILTADTIVFCKGKIYGIPKDRQEAFETLSALQGREHDVYTGLSLCWNSQWEHALEKTRVLLNPLNDKQIHHYLTHDLWEDKAGGYSIQRGGGLIVQKIEGCFYNVMGLPLNALQSLLMKRGINLWDFLKN